MIPSYSRTQLPAAAAYPSVGSRHSQANNGAKTRVSRTSTGSQIPAAHMLKWPTMIALPMKASTVKWSATAITGQKTVNCSYWSQRCVCRCSAVSDSYVRGL